MYADSKQKFRVLSGEFLKFSVTDFTDFTLCFRANPGTSIRLLEQSHFTKKVAFIEVGHNHLATIVVFNQDSDRTLDDVGEGVALIASVNDGTFGWIFSAVAVSEERFRVWHVGCDGCRSQLGFLLMARFFEQSTHYGHKRLAVQVRFYHHLLLPIAIRMCVKSVDSRSKGTSIMLAFRHFLD